MKVYFVEEEIWIVDSKKVINTKMKSLSMGRIINKEAFIDEFSLVLKKENIKSNLLGNKIYIVKNSYFNLSDTYFLEQVFLDLGFTKVEFLDIKNFYLNKDDIYIELNNKYLVFKDNLYDINVIGNIKVFLSLILPDEVNIVLYGSNNIITKLKLRGKNIYYVDNYNRFIVDSLLEVNC